MTSLFDFADEQEEQPDWHEVPQAVFLSWPDHMQLAYCAARDIDSASRGDTAEEIEFFLSRAKRYQEISK